AYLSRYFAWIGVPKIVQFAWMPTPREPPCRRNRMPAEALLMRAFNTCNSHFDRQFPSFYRGSIARRAARNVSTKALAAETTNSIPIRHVIRSSIAYPSVRSHLEQCSPAVRKHGCFPKQNMALRPFRPARMQDGAAPHGPSRQDA